ncbi:MAG: hypothetical protein JXB50_15470 [Spirochaetes bacterium]|nr:hypothetical protein [Spirochaetota bacterium]
MINNKITKFNINNEYFWYPLDNLAKIFPTNSSVRLTTLFRLSVSMNAPIKISILQDAFNHLLKRFPYFKVQLKSGFFWYYFQSNPNIPKIMVESKYPCMNMSFKKNGVLPFRLKAFKNRISVEFSHILTDGTGALSFLKALIAEYLKLSGVMIKNLEDIININDKPDEKEWEDSFLEHYHKNIPKPHNGSKAYHIPYRLIEKGKYYITTGILPLNKIIKITKEKNVSITDFFVSLFFEAIQNLYFSNSIKNKNRNPICISIPINLRNIYPSSTLRNFFLTVTPEIDPRLGKFSFDEILQKVHHFLRIEIDKKYINQQIKRNVGGEVNPVIRVLPLFIKNLVLSFIYSREDKLVTSNFSNLGKVTLPETISDYISGFDLYPPPNPNYKISCTAISFKDRLSITFGKLIEETDIERFFFKRLIMMGIPVKIETN